MILEEAKGEVKTPGGIVQRIKLLRKQAVRGVLTSLAMLR